MVGVRIDVLSFCATTVRGLIDLLFAIMMVLIALGYASNKQVLKLGKWLKNTVYAVGVG